MLLLLLLLLRPVPLYTAACSSPGHGVAGAKGPAFNPGPAQTLASAAVGYLPPGQSRCHTCTAGAARALDTKKKPKHEPSQCSPAGMLHPLSVPRPHV